MLLPPALQRKLKRSMNVSACVHKARLRRVVRPGMCTGAYRPYSIYQGLSFTTGQTVYYGMTSQAASIRGHQHGGRFDAVAIPGLQNLSYYQARAAEQYLIMQSGGAGGRSALVDRINSISPLNPNFAPLVRQGREIVNQNGY